MTFFILSIFTFSIVFLLYFLKPENRQWKKLFYPISFFFLMTLILIYSLKVKPYSRGVINSFWEEALLFFCLFLGTITTTIVQKIRGDELDLKPVHLVKPIFTAPIVFFAAWGAIEKMEDFNFITCCFAYTCGYYFDTFLKKVSDQIRKTETQEKIE